MAIHCTTVECGVSIKKKRKQSSAERERKRSQWVQWVQMFTQARTENFFSLIYRGKW